MTAKELAIRLNGREYRNEMTLEEMSIAKESGLVVVVGASDDLMEFHGAIEDEAGCFEGGKAYVSPSGIWKDYDCGGDQQCEFLENAKKKYVPIYALWAVEGYSWIYDTKIPHETFEIMEDGEKYCRGIVFSIEDLEPAPKYSPEKMERHFNLLRGVSISSHLPMPEKQQLTEFISYLESVVTANE